MVSQENQFPQTSSSYNLATPLILPAHVQFPFRGKITGLRTLEGATKTKILRKEEPPPNHSINILIFSVH